MHMKGEPMAGKENREIKNSVFVDLFYEDESAEANEIALLMQSMMSRCRKEQRFADSV